MKKKIIASLLSLTMVFSMTACGGKNTDSDVDYIKDKGTLVVGITDFEPMDYKDDSGEWVGFDADMAKMAADPATQRWWDVVKPLMSPLPDRAEGEFWSDMEEIYHLD